MNGVALVTGAARRIGRALAVEAARAGFDVAVHHRQSPDEAEETAALVRAEGRQALTLDGDLTTADAAHLIARAEALGPVTLLVNNASMFLDDRFQTARAEDIDLQMATNLRAPVFLSQAFARQLSDGEEGNIISIIDQRVWKLNPRFFSYTTSKSGLWTATRTLAQALAPRIRVNAIGPGPALPSARMDQAEFDKQAKLTLLGRGTSPEEISAAVKFILSQPSLTGQMIALDGGQHLVWQTPDVVEVNE